eukprot:4533935-Prymnesium_polylepis.2
MARLARRSLQEALVHHPTMARHNLQERFGADFRDLSSMTDVLSAARDRREELRQATVQSARTIARLSPSSAAPALLSTNGANLAQEYRALGAVHSLRGDAARAAHYTGLLRQQEPTDLARKRLLEEKQAARIAAAQRRRLLREDD